MRCLYPRTVGFHSDGKTICWSPRKISKEYALFQLPCGKCIECRLEYARTWAIRCVNEAQMHEANCFITLTYDKQHLKSPKLIYSDFQDFVKRLRDKIFRDFVAERFGPKYWSSLTPLEKKHFRKEYNEELRKRTQIGIFVTGEYGDEGKRPHWHACIFNWKPQDGVFKYTNNNNDPCYTSETLSQLWGKGICEFGEVTFKSAGYCARYAAKKLSHGYDGSHDYEPISKKSSKNAIGKSFYQRYFQTIFDTGAIVLHDGTHCPIPRTYERWFAKDHPEKFRQYLQRQKTKRMEVASINNAIKEKRVREINEERFKIPGQHIQITENQVRAILAKQRLMLLNSFKKL